MALDSLLDLFAHRLYVLVLFLSVLVIPIRDVRQHYWQLVGQLPSQLLGARKNSDQLRD